VFLATTTVSHSTSHRSPTTVISQYVHLFFQKDTRAVVLNAFAHLKGYHDDEARAGVRSYASIFFFIIIYDYNSMLPIFGVPIGIEHAERPIAGVSVCSTAAATPTEDDKLTTT